MLRAIRAKWRQRRVERQLAKLDPRVKMIEDFYLAYRAFVFNGITDLPDLARAPVVHRTPSNVAELKEIVNQYEQRTGRSANALDSKFNDSECGEVTVTMFSDLEEIRDSEFFISYRHADAKQTEWYFQLLHIGMSRFKAFVDSHFFMDPSHWRKFVAEAIGEGTIFVLFWSGRSELSEAIRYEVGLAEERGAVILIVSTDGGRFPLAKDHHLLIDLTLPVRETPIGDLFETSAYSATSVAQELALLGYVVKFMSVFPRELHGDIWKLILLTNRLRPPPKTLFPRLK